MLDLTDFKKAKTAKEIIEAIEKMPCHLRHWIAAAVDYYHHQQGNEEISQKLDLYSGLSYIERMIESAKAERQVMIELGCEESEIKRIDSRIERYEDYRKEVASELDFI